MNEAQLMQEADGRARSYVAGIGARNVFPDAKQLAGLSGFDEPLPETGRQASETIRLLDEAGSPATVASNGPNYFGFVIGATLPVAAAAERIAVAWTSALPLSPIRRRPTGSRRLRRSGT